jgi:3-deoxy-D-manno-octulosonate 8-phosphate phosphatase (KDO 8-P phosphatase)
MENILLIVYDFDGVMTDNKVYIDQKGNEMVKVNRADGLGISEINKMGIHQVIISTEKNPVVSARAEKLGILCLQGIENKKRALLNFCQENNFNLQNVAYVGNDINDLEAMEIVGTSFCPADSQESIKSICDQILETNGGDGVIRELVNIIIRNNK